jgi:holin-like protein
MSLINGLLILLLCQCAGEVIKTTFALSLPGPVLGMLILFIGLCLYRKTPESIAKASQTLIPMLGLMFLPASAGLFFLGSQFDDQWPAIIAAVVLGSFLSLIFNGLLMRFLTRKKGSDKKGDVL